MFLLVSADFFQNYLFQKFFQNTVSVSNGLNPDQDQSDILSVLIWVQTVCKGYQQTIKVAASKERVKEDKMKANVYICHKIRRLMGILFIHSIQCKL